MRIASSSPPLADVFEQLHATVRRVGHVHDVVDDGDATREPELTRPLPRFTEVQQQPAVTIEDLDDVAHALDDVDVTLAVEGESLRALEGDLGFSDHPYSGFVDRFRGAFLRETNAFVSFALGDIDNPCPPHSALESLRIAIACEQSVNTRAAVRVSGVH